MAIQKTKFKEPYPFELFLPQRPGPLPLICLTPILGRLVFMKDLFFERWFAQFFASEGFACALIDRPIFEFVPDQGLEQIQTYLEESIERNKKVLDFILTKKEIDPKRVGSFGMSFGAIVNSLWAGKDARLKANVFALAGGNLPQILVSSRDPLMRSYIKSMVQGTGILEKDLAKNLEKVITLDPLRSALSLSKENVFLLLGIFDRVVRFRYGLAFREALGKPKTRFLPLGHYTSLALVPLIQWEVSKFFRDKL